MSFRKRGLREDTLATSRSPQRGLWGLKQNLGQQNLTFLVTNLIAFPSGI
jgi:hypothetical protein